MAPLSCRRSCKMEVLIPRAVHSAGLGGTRVCYGHTRIVFTQGCGVITKLNEVAIFNIRGCSLHSQHDGREPGSAPYQTDLAIENPASSTGEVVPSVARRRRIGIVPVPGYVRSRFFVPLMGQSRRPKATSEAMAQGRHVRSEPR